MKLDDLKTGFDSLKKRNYNTEELYLIFSRECWESDLFKKGGYLFSKEELDAAEKLDVKLIGTRKGVKCYLPPKKP